jgi:hypothetical protein
MRKATKKNIELAKCQYVLWMRAIGPRIDTIPQPHRARVYSWTSDVLDRITGGELGMCTAALMRSVEREIEAWESGYYPKVSMVGC